ncbi:hypothetical protein SEA_ATUIN_268 [Arthrobacter phage Atuin]|nr:hypothetical protein SEA_ATUIN_67 [Arthrobacter phage Atuin]
MYYITFDGQYPLPAGENLAFATELFYRSVRKNDWCPALVDEEGVRLVSWDNSSYDGDGYDLIIGPVPDLHWHREHGGWDRIAEEHEYKFGDWRL